MSPRSTPPFCSIASGLSDLRRQARLLAKTIATPTGRLVMLRDRKVIASIPIADILHVAVHGPITFTGPALAGLLDAGIDVTLHSSAARLRGVIHSHDAKNVFLTLAQVATGNDPARRLKFARVLLASKIARQRQLVHHHARSRLRGVRGRDRAARRAGAQGLGRGRSRRRPRRSTMVPTPFPASGD